MLKYHSDMGHCFSLVLVVSKKVKNSTFLYWENRHGIGEKDGYFRLGMGLKFGPMRWAENPL